MTQDEIIRMAQEAGFTFALGFSGKASDWSEMYKAWPEEVERFAALVAEATKEKAAKEGWMAASSDCEDRVAAAIRGMK